ncbi:hypothetical protein C8J46_11416 [Sphingomonas sp. PP-F2F-A104-K0414]|uniref:hypothetical protein n=1 Tax=Sphingomonas sp. PP-F2F-A104-K0414 TaxID=2135661 RepID=UPI001047787D|nr:hypothetical protein [Sphingomonas sp. PP-F2F-A104-K0414]TCP95287.1 hypothetical protein C8J46_11416 [Sphingomonas sp. PP-F2F-A104-K0414]
MMKTLAAFGLASCATVAPAQFIFISPNANPTTGSTFGAHLPQIDPIGGQMGVFDNTITPTMRRERQERSARTLRFIASAPDKWTSSNPREARRLYAKAETAAKWAKVNSDDKSM